MFHRQILRTLVVLFCLPFFADALNIRATTCNGNAALCNRSYGNITYVGAHDSYAVGTNNIAANQDRNVTQQLTDGIRLLQVQAHNSSGQIELCHTDCALYDGGTLQNYLSTVKTWLDSNPNDVVSLLIVNIDNLPVSQYASVFTAAGVVSLSYSPPSASIPASGWPTLSSMIAAGTRLVTFMDNAADFTTVPYIIDEFTNIWESAFDITDPALFNCQVNRSKADTSTSMFLINHFLDNIVLGALIPDVTQANVTNAVSGVGSLGLEVSTCVSLYNRSPNFLLVDYYEAGGGSVFDVAATANGVPAPTFATSSTPAATSTSSSTSSSVRVSIGLDWSLALSFTGVLFGAISILI